MITQYDNYVKWKSDAQDPSKQDIPLLVSTHDETTDRAYIKLRMTKGIMLSQAAHEYYGEFNKVTGKGVLCESVEEFLTHINSQNQ
jgi:hypothetical protein